jgi:hypothetical protein
MVTAMKVKAGVTAPNAHRAAHRQRNDLLAQAAMIAPRAESPRTDLPDRNALLVQTVPSVRLAPSARHDHHVDRAPST